LLQFSKRFQLTTEIATCLCLPYYYQVGTASEQIVILVPGAVPTVPEM